MKRFRIASHVSTVVQILLLCLRPKFNLAWGGGDDDSESQQTAIFGNGLNRDWLYNSNAISIRLEGCVWGYASDHDNADCMENGSSDGTTYWYQMANCRRAQAVYRMYASSSGNSASCNSQNFKESFITSYGLSEFLGYVKNYDANNQFDDDAYANAEDDGLDDDGGNNKNYDEFPNCEKTNNGYVGLGCTEDGKFAIQYFSDAYCLTPTGKTYDKLNSLNRALKSYTKCAGISYGNVNGEGGSLPELLISTSASCSSLDSAYCSDSVAMQQRRSSSSISAFRTYANIVEKSWVTKLKYATGGLLLLASFVMFTGILFTNRRRRRALMQRKYRQSRSERSRKSRSSKSRTRKSSRSKSRARDKEGEGYFT